MTRLRNTIYCLTIVLLLLKMNSLLPKVEKAKNGIICDEPLSKKLKLEEEQVG